MPIDIDKLAEAELIDLNNRVVARLKFLPQMRAHAHMLDFSIGEKVSFQPEGRPLLTGIIAKYNRKTVTVIAERAAVERRARVPAQGRVVCAGEAALRAGPQPARGVGGRPGECHAAAGDRAAAIASPRSANGKRVEVDDARPMQPIAARRPRTMAHRPAPPQGCSTGWIGT